MEAAWLIQSMMMGECGPSSATAAGDAMNSPFEKGVDTTTRWKRRADMDASTRSTGDTKKGARRSGGEWGVLPKTV